MSRLFGDERECAKAISSILFASEEERVSPSIDREVSFQKRAYFFGHYDSRGGGFVTTSVPGIVMAFEKYNGIFGNEPGSDLDWVLEDFIGRYELVVLDKPLPGVDSELLSSYSHDGSGYNLGKLERQMKGIDSWFDIGVAMLWAGDAPVIPSVTTSTPGMVWEYRIVPWDIGEDACGLVLF